MKKAKLAQQGVRLFSRNEWRKMKKLGIQPPPEAIAKVGNISSHEEQEYAQVNDGDQNSEVIMEASHWEHHDKPSTRADLQESGPSTEQEYACTRRVVLLQDLSSDESDSPSPEDNELLKLFKPKPSNYEGKGKGRGKNTKN